MGCAAPSSCRLSGPDEEARRCCPPTRFSRGRRILVVEDDFFVADEVTHGLRRHGAEVVGPAPTVAAALALLDGAAALDGAALDVNLGGEMV